MLDCLRKGSIIEGPAPTINGEWECTVERNVAGDRVKVGVVIDDDGDLIVKTAM